MNKRPNLRIRDLSVRAQRSLQTDEVRGQSGATSGLGVGTAVLGTPSIGSPSVDTKYMGLTKNNDCFSDNTVKSKTG